MSAIASVKIGCSRFLFADTLLSGRPDCPHTIQLPDRRVVINSLPDGLVAPIRCASKLSAYGDFAIAWAGDLAPASEVLSHIDALHESKSLTYNAIKRELEIATDPDQGDNSAAFILCYYDGTRMVTEAIGSPLEQLYPNGQRALAFGTGASTMLKVVEGIINSEGGMKPPYSSSPQQEDVQLDDALTAAHCVIGRMIGLNSLHNDALVRIGVGGPYESAYFATNEDGQPQFKRISDVAYVLWELVSYGEMKPTDSYQDGKYAHLAIKPISVCSVKNCGSTFTYIRAKPCGCHEVITAHDAHRLPYEIDYDLMQDDINSTDWTPLGIVDVVVDRWTTRVHVGTRPNQDRDSKGGSNNESAVSISRTESGYWITRLSETYCNELADGFVESYVRPGVTAGYTGGYSFTHDKDQEF